MKKKKYGYDPFDAVMSHGKITIGTVGVMGLAGSMPSSPSSGNILRGMDTLKVVPTVHATGIAFGSLGMLGDVEKQIKKQRR